jgi:ketosteroid isomerase-like protein
MRKHDPRAEKTRWDDVPLLERMLMQEVTMAINGVTIADLKRAIESRDANTLSGFYADDAVVRIIDRDNPPSKPRELRGKTAIVTFYDDICSRAIAHKVESGVADGDRLAFTQACAYPDGARVFCSAMLELKAGKIARQTTVQAWDS